MPNHSFDAAAQVAIAGTLVEHRRAIDDAIGYLELSAPEPEFRREVACHAGALAVARTALGWTNSAKQCLRALNLLTERRRWMDSCIYDLADLARWLATCHLNRGAALLRI